jgi:tRNA splicing ligase
MSAPIYIGLFLTKDSQHELVDLFARETVKLHDHVYADHITLKFKPTDNDMKMFTDHIGKRYKISVNKMIADVGAQVIPVNVSEIPQEFRGILGSQKPHITLACKYGVKPVYSNTLLNRSESDYQTYTFNGLELEMYADTFPKTLPIQ